MNNTNSYLKGGESFSPLALYIHIPFCHSKCSYCDFLSFPKMNKDAIDDYLQALKAELQQIKIMRPVTSIFIGGGTPSILSVEQLNNLMSMIQEYVWFNQQIEFTIEANPGTVTKEKLDCLIKNKVNRISFGVQTFHEEIRKKLGRIHTVAQAIESIQLAQAVGFHNINIDLMLGLSSQTLEILTQSIEQAAKLNVTHISMYALILEEETGLFQEIEKGIITLPEEDLVAGMLDIAEEKLAYFGYQQYELSNFGRPNFACQHNIVYWKMHDYIGVGLGSAGAQWLGQTLMRKSNTSDWKEYMQAWKNKESIPIQMEVITGKDLVFERIMLGLRMNEGIAWSEFQERFHCDVQKTYQQAIEKNMQLGLLACDKQIMHLTKKGRRLQNNVLLDFME